MSTEAERRAKRRAALQLADDRWHAAQGQTLPDVPQLPDRVLLDRLVKQVRTFQCKFSIACYPPRELLAEYEQAHPDLKFWIERHGTKRHWHCVTFADPV
jgi:hypothetical protein